MALIISELCIVCDLCLTVCPNEAISAGEEVFTIDPARCTECVGHFDESQCVKVCPVRAISPDPAHVEDRAALKEKYTQLQAQKNA